jgi:uncharacterized protein (TIGR00255 family)
MTGFGRSARETADETFEVEVRSVNNRSLKIQPRISESAAVLAARVEHHVRERIERGTLHVTIKHRQRGASSAYRLDERLLKHYALVLDKVSRELQWQGPIDMAQVAQLPGVVSQEESLEGDLEAFWERLRPVLDEALERLVSMRREEGSGIAQNLRSLADRIVELSQAVEGRVEGAVEDYRKKLRTRIDKLLRGTGVPTPEADLARELAVFADRSDISEELQRLRSHVGQLRATVDSEAGEPVGRKLEFLAQELLREANTMAAKSHDTSLVESVLSIKLEVEKVREQVANVE